MDIPVRVEWVAGSHRFALELSGEMAVLRLPDGQTLHLNNADWHALAQVISQHLPTATKKPSVRSMAGKPWTEHEEKELRECFSKGMALSTIAQNLKRSRGAIDARLVKLGLMAYRPPHRG